MKRNLLVVALLLSNLLLVGSIVYQRSRPAELAADHVQGARLDIEHGGNLRIALGRSSTPSGALIANAESAGTLVLTPRAAVQLHVALGQSIQQIREAAELVREPRATSADSI